MPFTKDEGQFITLAEGVSWTANYRGSQYFNGTKTQFYGKAKINQILQQPGCTGLRIYYAVDNTDTAVLVLVGTNIDGNDLQTGLILERGISCPPNCGGGGGVNSLQGQ